MGISNHIIKETVIEVEDRNENHIAEKKNEIEQIQV
jgi:hypothetical protein